MASGRSLYPLTMIGDDCYGPPMLIAAALVSASFVLAAPAPKAAPKAPPKASPKASPAAAPKPAHLLLVTVTKGFKHDSIPDLERLVTGIGTETGAFDVDVARTDEELAAKTTPAALAGYDGLVLPSTTGDLPVADRDALVKWIEDGHALIGIHAASDTFHGFPAYLDLLGGEFAHHGPQVKVHVLVDDRENPATRTLGADFEVFDEIYQFKRFDPGRVHLLLSMDKHPETGEPGQFPLSWTREQGKGRVFYTALGHRQDVIAAPWYREHVKGGIAWALRSPASTR
jgi:type 1 glutamine amidotransferase